MDAHENLTAQGQQKVGALRHGGYWLWRVLRSGAPNRRSAVGRRFEARRLAYAVAQGYPAWSSCPAPLQAAIDNVIRQEFLAAALFSGFWTGGPEAVPRVYHTAAENLRRQLSDIGLEPRSPSLDVAALLAGMQKPDARTETPPRASHAKEQGV